MEEKTEDKSMKELLMDIAKGQKELVDQKKSKQKKFRLPWNAKVGKQKLKKGFATFAYIHENREVEFFKTQIDEGAMRKNDNFHVATARYGLTYKGKPLFIIPSWSTEPFCPDEHLSESEEKERTTMGQRYVFNKMKMDIIKDKKSGLSLWWILGGLAALAVLAFVASKGQLKLF